MKLLNLPTNGTVLLSFTRRILSQVVGHDIFRALGREYKPEQLHSMPFGEILQMNGFSMGLFGLAEVECIHLCGAGVHRLNRQQAGCSLADNSRPFQVVEWNSALDGGIPTVN